MSVPLPVGQVNYVDLCIEAVVLRLRTSITFMPGGNLGIVTIEREHPQPDDEPRSYPRAALPALAVSAKSEPSDYIATGTREMPVEIRVRCVHESANTRDCDEKIMHILENTRAFILEQIRIYTGTFLGDIGAGVGEDGIGSISDVEQMKKWPYRFHASLTLPLHIVHSFQGGGPN